MTFDAATSLGEKDASPRTRKRREVTHFCLYDVVWAPKFGRPVLASYEAELSGLLHALAADVQAKIVRLDVQPALVAARLNIDPTVGLHKTVHHLKARTSSVLRAKWPALKSRVPSLWNSRYFVATVDASPARSELEAFLAQQRYS